MLYYNLDFYKILNWKRVIMFDLSLMEWIWIIVAAFFVGFSKMGISGVLMPIIPILASMFGGKESTGLMLPILLTGDIIAVIYYRQHAEWKAIQRLMIWTSIGLALGAFVGNYINDIQFKTIVAVSILICVGILIYTEVKGNRLKVPEKLWFYALMGMASGFTTMIGNAAGPIMSVYLLAMGYNKNSFIGTSAWFFLIVNALKVPLQVFVWHNISLNNALLAAIVFPAVALGAYGGANLVKRIKETPYRYLIIVMTTIGAIRLLF